MTNLFNDGARRPFEWVEIDQPICINVFGLAPCLAVLTPGNQKCFNTRITCQSAANYNDEGSVKVLRFCHNQAQIPDDFTYFPLLESVSISGAKLNPGGGSGNSSALGIRGTLSASFSDALGSDFIVDPYLSGRNYNPLERGSFWTKWRARNPYYMHRVIRYKTGFLDEFGQVDPATLTTRTFFITGFGGPDNSGGVTISAKDILTLAANDKATAPRASLGLLLADLTAVALNFTLTPTGIGNTNYPLTGKVRIDKEIFNFTRAADVMTVIRAQNGTAAVTHKAGAVVQLCKIYGAIIGEAPHNIIYDLLVNFANVSASFIDYQQWAAEAADYLPRLYNAVIAQPEGVTALITEICEQMYLTLFWDDRVSLLKLKAVRPAENEPVTELTDYKNLLEGATNWTDKPDSLITQVWTYFAQIDPTEKINEPKNFGALEISVDPESESLQRNGIQKIKTIFSRWISGANGGAAIDLGAAILARYASIPREVIFSLDAKDGALWLADFITVQNRNVVDFTGTPLPLQMQVISAAETVQGSVYTYSAIEYIGQQYTPPGEYILPIATNQLDVNLRAIFDTYLAVIPTAGDVVRFIIEPNVIIGATAPGTYNGDLLVHNPNSNPKTSFIEPTEFNYLTRRNFTTPREYFLVDFDDYIDPVSGISTGFPVASDILEIPPTAAVSVGNWPAGVELILQIEAGAKIIGHGGSGGKQTRYNGEIDLREQNFEPIPAGDGGTAINAISYPITVINNGTIAGGGGGGAALTYNIRDFGYKPNNDIVQSISGVLSGGGGAGYNGGIFANAILYSNGDTGLIGFHEPKSEAGSGSLMNGGEGAITWVSLLLVSNPFRILTGGLGGSIGYNGLLAKRQFSQDGIKTNIGPNCYGLAGYAIQGGANITFQGGTGLILGEIIP